MQILEVKVYRGSTMLKVQPARKNPLGESFETVPLPEKPCEVLLLSDARIVTAGGESGTAEVFVDVLARRPARERNAGFDLTYNPEMNVSRADWLFVPSW